MELSINPLDTEANLLSSSLFLAVAGGGYSRVQIFSAQTPKSLVSLVKVKALWILLDGTPGNIFFVLNTIKIVILLLHICILK